MFIPGASAEYGDHQEASVRTTRGSVSPPGAYSSFSTSMSNFSVHRPPRRGPTPEPRPQQQYSAVAPQSPPQSPQSARSTRRAPSRATTEEVVQAQGSGRAGIIQGVATGHIGADYGPYSVRGALVWSSESSDMCASTIQFSIAPTLARVRVCGEHRLRGDQHSRARQR